MTSGRQVRTFLFGDIEGSTRRWEADPTGMGEAVAAHDEIVSEAVGSSGGVVFKHTGDGFYAVFEDPVGAIGAAVQAQKELAGLGLPVRMGVQTGPAEGREGDWFGSTLNSTARLMDAGSGGQVLVGESTEVLVRSQLPEGVSLDDLGRHRFRDLGEAQEVFQVVHPNLSSEFGPIKSVDYYPNNLPVLMTTFVGREREVAAVTEAMGSSRLVTLTGVGGVGKTRLSLAVAAAVADRFPGGTWFVGLAPLADGGLIVTEALSAMGVPGDHREPIDVLISRTDDQPTLFLFDNCEHLIDEAAKVVETLVLASPTTAILPTSREALGVMGEATYPVPSLRGEAGLSEAVELFVNRAHLVDPEFVVDESNREVVEQICERLDGIPLAIELATARLRVMSPEGIAERLDDRFRLLTGGSRTALPRQRTLAAAMDWSYDLLGEMEQTLLRRLAVFSGGFDLPAVEAVCTDDKIDPLDVLDLLDRLVSASLVSHGAHNRYWMLETVRQYAVDKLAETGEMPLLRGRHLDFFQKVASGINEGLLGPDADRMFRQSRADLDNLRLAMTWGVESGDPEAAGRISVGLYRLWQSMRAWQEAETWYRRLLDKVEDPGTKAWIAVSLGNTRGNVGNEDEGLAMYDFALTITENPGGSDLDQAMWMVQLGNRAMLNRSTAREAHRLHLESVKYAASLPYYDPPLWMATLSGTKLDPTETPDYDRVLEELGSRLQGDPQAQRVVEGSSWYLMGLLRQGRIDEIESALERFDEAVQVLYGEDAIARERAIRGLDHIVGMVAVDKGDLEGAGFSLERFLRFSEQDISGAGIFRGWAITIAVLVGLFSNDSVESARAGFERFYHRVARTITWWDQLWAASLLAEADSQPVVSARLLGANDHERIQSGVVLYSQVQEFDSGLRARLASQLDDFEIQMGLGSELSPEEIAGLLDQVASGRYE